ncbi:hypothetical protein [Dactylosporangium sp. NPDC051541]|uniref:hypothetical protein n=1 Tax=Dactylosporangium sp. NPDC051541 TaxID=3363977 RepID=UPI0037B901A9
MIEETLRGYAGDETPPSRLQAEDVYRHASAAHRRRRAAAMGGAAALAVLVLAGIAFVQPGRGPAGQAGATAPPRTATAAAPPGPTLSPLPPVAPGCTVAPLSAEADQKALGIAGLTADPTGRYIIGWGVSGAVVWVDGHRQALPTGFGPAAVNASGTIAGTNGDRAAVVRDGTMTDLPALPGFTQVRVSAINARGDVVGEARTDSGDHRAVIWPAAGGYKVFNSPVSTANAIADDGTVYGTVSMVPTKWTPGGQATPLPMPPGYHTGWAGSSSGDQLFGEVASGESGTDPEGDRKGELSGERIYVRWHLGSGTVEQIGHPESGLYPTSGTIYPATVDTVGVTGTIVANVYGKALLYRGNVPVALPQYQDRNMRISWVSADGHTILGVAGSTSDNSSLIVVWTGC